MYEMLTLHCSTEAASEVIYHKRCICTDIINAEIMLLPVNVSVAVAGHLTRFFIAFFSHILIIIIN